MRSEPRTEMLAHQIHGTGERLVLVHGFTQTRRSWESVASHLAYDFVDDSYEVISIDAPGHGESQHVALDLRHGADALVAVGGLATYIGYSMGARLCLHVALAHPGFVKRLVLISATAGIDDPTERAERVASDEALALRVEQIGVAAFVDEWLARPLFDYLSADLARRDLRLQNTSAGLATSLRLCGSGTQEPLWNQLHELRMPVLVVAGAKDTKFAALANRLVEAIDGNATLQIIPDTGHSPHLEQPEIFVAKLREFLIQH